MFTNVGSYYGLANDKAQVLSLKKMTEVEKSNLITSGLIKEVASALDWMNAVVKISSMGISYDDMLKFVPTARGDILSRLKPQCIPLNMPNLVQPYLSKVEITKNPNSSDLAYDQAISSAKRINIPPASAYVFTADGSAMNGQVMVHTVGYKVAEASQDVEPAGEISQRVVYDYDDDEYMVTMKYRTLSQILAEQGTPAEGETTITSYATFNEFVEDQDNLMDYQNTTYGGNLSLGFGDYSLTEVRNELLMVIGFYIDSVFPILDRLLNFECSKKAVIEAVESAGFEHSDAFVITESVRPSNMMVQQTKLLVETAIKSAADNQEGIDMPSGGDIITYMSQLTPSIKSTLDKITKVPS